MGHGEDETLLEQRGKAFSTLQSAEHVESINATIPVERCEFL